MKLTVLIAWLVVVSAGLARTEDYAERRRARSSIEAEENLFFEVRKAYRNDKETVRELEATQDAWTKYRDAALNAEFPDLAMRQKEGSEYFFAYYRRVCEITDVRIAELKRWVDGSLHPHKSAESDP